MQVQELYKDTDIPLHVKDTNQGVHYTTCYEHYITFKMQYTLLEGCIKQSYLGNSEEGNERWAIECVVF